MQIGMQLYSLRDYCKTLDDFAETLKKVADIGYKTVQVSGTCEYEGEWLDEQLKKNGLVCPLTHYNTDKILHETENVIALHKKFGCKNIGMGALPNGANGLNDADNFIKAVNDAGKIAKENGMYLMYHNHHFEFNHTAEGITYLEKFANEINPGYMGFTLDTYWVQVGGGNPAEWIMKLKGRLPCIHLKDLVMSGTEQHFAAVGSGNINFEPIVAAAEAAGTQYMFVEEDDCFGKDPFDEAKSSYKYLSSLGLK